MSIVRFGVSLEKELLEALDNYVSDNLIAIKGIQHGKLTMSRAD